MKENELEGACEAAVKEYFDSLWPNCGKDTRHLHLTEIIQRHMLPAIRSYAALERAGMREACAKELNAELESIKDEDAEVRAIQRLLKVRTRIRYLPDTAADEAIERVKREWFDKGYHNGVEQAGTGEVYSEMLERVKAVARLEEAKWWQKRFPVQSGDSPGDMEGEERERIAALTETKEKP